MTAECVQHDFDRPIVEEVRDHARDEPPRAERHLARCCRRRVRVDPRATGMRHELLEIWERDRKTVLFVTHSVEEAVFLSDRVVVLTRAPGHIKRIVGIDLPRPRRRAELLVDRRYQEYVVDIEKLMDHPVEVA